MEQELAVARVKWLRSLSQGFSLAKKCIIVYLVLFLKCIYLFKLLEML